MASKQLFYYLGDDEAYFRALQGEFKRHTRLMIDFRRFYESDDSRIQSLFLKIFQNKPDCVFIDFSKQTQDYLQLARLISRTPLEHKMMTIGLVDYLSPPEIIRESIATGINLSFIKSSETFDVVFSTSKLVSPDEAKEHGFATADLKEEWEAGTIAKIGYVHHEGIHIETDQTLAKGDRMKLHHHWLEKRVVPSKEIFVKDTSTSNLFYQFKYNADLDFIFVDDFLPPEGMEESKVNEKKTERDDLVHYHKKQLQKWIEANASKSHEKKAKMLVVDREFHFYQGQERTDKHPYTIRCIPFFKEMGQEIDRLRPQVIAVQLEKEEAADAKNNLAMIKDLINLFKGQFPDLLPFIILFNTEKPSKDLQNELQYPQVLSHSSEVSVEVLMKMAAIFDKRVVIPTAPKNNKPEPPKVFIKKNNPASLAEFLKPVTVIKISESDLILQSDYSYPPGTNLHFTQPVNMFVNIQPVKGEGKTPSFYGLIHCLGEVEKKELRRYVNSIFFREHDAQLQSESEEFKKLNEMKLLQMQEEAAAAAKAKAAAAEAEKDKA